MYDYDLPTSPEGPAEAKGLTLRGCFLFSSYGTTAPACNVARSQLSILKDLNQRFAPSSNKAVEATTHWQTAEDRPFQETFEVCPWMWQNPRNP